MAAIGRGLGVLLGLLIFFGFPVLAKAALPTDQRANTPFMLTMMVPQVSIGTQTQLPMVSPAEIMLRQKQCIAAKASARRAFGVTTDAQARALMLPMEQFLLNADDALEDSASLHLIGMTVWRVQELTVTRRILAMVRVLNNCPTPGAPIEVRR